MPLLLVLLLPESISPVQQTFAHSPVSWAGCTQWRLLFSV